VAYLIGAAVLLRAWYVLSLTLRLVWPRFPFSAQSNVADGFSVRESARMLGGFGISFIPELLYFTAWEGLWGKTLGKWLLGLRVCRAVDGRPPGLPRALVRTAVFGLLMHLPVQIIYWLPLDCLTQIILMSLARTQVAGLLLAMATMRERNGYRGTHEFASGTRVMRLGWPRRTFGAAWRRR